MLVVSDVLVLDVEPTVPVLEVLPVVWFCAGEICPALLDELPDVEPVLVPAVPALPACAMAMPNAKVSTTAKIKKRVLIETLLPGGLF